MTRFIRGYLRASTKEQDASRARADLEQFTSERGQKIAAWYVENESGAKLQRPELFRLINEAHHGDVLLIEQVDRLSRLNAADWETLKAKLNEKRIRVVALDLPTSWSALSATRRFAISSGVSSKSIVPSWRPCCWTCSRPWPARITWIAAAGRPKASRRRRTPAFTVDAQPMSSGTRTSLSCWTMASLGRRLRR